MGDTPKKNWKSMVRLTPDSAERAKRLADKRGISFNRMIQILVSRDLQHQSVKSLVEAMGAKHQAMYAGLDAPGRAQRMAQDKKWLQAILALVAETQGLTHSDRLKVIRTYAERHR